MSLTKTLEESLALQAEFTRLDTLYLAATDDKVKETLEKQIKAVKKRLYTLPNYNMNGLEKIMKFLKPYLNNEPNVQMRRKATAPY